MLFVTDFEARVALNLRTTVLANLPLTDSPTIRLDAMMLSIAKWVFLMVCLREL